MREKKGREKKLKKDVEKRERKSKNKVIQGRKHTRVKRRRKKVRKIKE